jgi:hypothetical protein
MGYLAILYLRAGFSSAAAACRTPAPQPSAGSPARKYRPARYGRNRVRRNRNSDSTRRHWRTTTHRDHPARLRHLVVNFAQRRRHLVRQRARHDHHVGLARAGARNNTETVKVITRHVGMDHLDRAARQTERHRPHRTRARPVEQRIGENHGPGNAKRNNHEDQNRQVFDEEILRCHEAKSPFESACPFYHYRA